MELLMMRYENMNPTPDPPCWPKPRKFLTFCHALVDGCLAVSRLSSWVAISGVHAWIEFRFMVMASFAMAFWTSLGTLSWSCSAASNGDGLLESSSSSSEAEYDDDDDDVEKRQPVAQGILAWTPTTCTQGRCVTDTNNPWQWENSP